MLWFLGLVVFVYYLVYLIVPWFLDCDLMLAFKEKFGKPIDSLKGQVVWITGASSGIGEHLAYTLAKAGCKLVLSARREKELQRVKEKCLEISHLSHDDVQVLVLDVCKMDDHEKAFNHVVDHFGKLDILVNNAGRSQRASWEKIDLQVDKDMFDLNVFSVLALTRRVVKYFMKTGVGHVVVNSSIAGLFGLPFSASYCGSKHALHGYFASLRSEKLDSNIAVTLVCPGPIQTNFLEEAFTGNPNEKFGQKTNISSNKLSAERCGYLMAIAVANKLPEVWISFPAALQISYLNRYYPNLASPLMKLMGQKNMQRMRDSEVTCEESSKND